MDPSPRELVIRARQRDAAAFAQLVTRHERTALAAAYAITGDATAAGDVAQESFLKAWRLLDSLDDPDRFPAWLAKIVRNLALDHRRRPRLTTESHDLSTLDLPAPTDPAGSAMEQAETRRRIDQALAELDETTRSIVLLRYYDGLSSRQIADTLDLSPAAVDMRLSRARTQLRQKLSPAPDFNP